MRILSRALVLALVAAGGEKEINLHVNGRLWPIVPIRARPRDVGKRCEAGIGCFLARGRLAASPTGRRPRSTNADSPKQSWAER